MPWPLYLYTNTPCVRRGMERFNAMCIERGRARRLSLDGAAEEVPSAALDGGVTSEDIGSKKQAMLSGQSGSEKAQCPEDSCSPVGKGSSDLFSGVGMRRIARHLRTKRQSKRRSEAREEQNDVNGPMRRELATTRVGPPWKGTASG
ncbi:hypothetical protein C8T65DRAFT_71388 [Cerioporus squamosus]|nr:hypothetical protein C8T65DRAFT_71388 [Cerioporus squamosus]